MTGGGQVVTGLPLAKVIDTTPAEVIVTLHSRPELFPSVTNTVRVAEGAHPPVIVPSVPPE